MLWFGRQAKDKGSAGRDDIPPASLEVQFDKDIAQSKLDGLLKELGERGGLEPYLEALKLKHELFLKALPEDRPAEISRETFNTLLSSIFPARRKLAETLGHMDDATLARVIGDLIYGEGVIEERIQAFCELVPKDEKKPRRAMWDLAAELLHFRAPERIPLMTRWVWDANTTSGALREFLRGNDALREIPLDTRPGTFQASRAWFGEFLAERGFYRDLPFLVDMLLAQAYADYVKAMSAGIGMVDAEFGGRGDPLELVLKLLGIDPRARDVKDAHASADEPTIH